MAALLNESWHVLGNAERRRSYDAHLAEAAERAQRGSGSATVTEPTSRRPDRQSNASDSTSWTCGQCGRSLPRHINECWHEQSSTSSERRSWTCLRCGRAVPRYVDDCRCGQSRPQPHATTSKDGNVTRVDFWPRSTWDRWRLAAVAFIVLTQAYNLWTKHDAANLPEGKAASFAQSQTIASVPPRQSTTNRFLTSISPTPSPTANGPNDSADPESSALREIEQQKWEERREQATVEAPRQRQPVTNAPPASIPATSISSSTVTTPLDKMRQVAESAFGPTLVALSRRADTLDANFRRYLDGCYEKVTRATTNGTSLGFGSADSVGVAVGPRGPFAWEVASNFAWQESWGAETNIDNETTAHCRTLWSDIADDMGMIRSGLANIDEAARRAGIYPGVIRDLRAKYGFAR